jgi:hypothetical protein
MSMKSPNPVDVHVGRRIKMRRMMLNMLQSDLGETSAGITFQQIQKSGCAGSWATDAGCGELSLGGYSAPKVPSGRI